MNKFVLLGIFFLIFLAGLGVIISNENISYNDFLLSLNDLNPRVLALIALPFIGVAFVLGIQFRKRSEARMWKKAVLKSRAKKES